MARQTYITRDYADDRSAQAIIRFAAAPRKSIPTMLAGRSRRLDKRRCDSSRAEPAMGIGSASAVALDANLAEACGQGRNPGRG
jgi:hypothetical protein